eukprot:TRINITY_DN480_c0_g1_i4.p2 TRINITY_DN480_c0_g1~~TRINITY_DN480_c0_g1_i4.p2  ORF type:complete len:148 (-),score=38.93 TRINITY_DN480_c0_g1_i4:555-998(-)
MLPRSGGDVPTLVELGDDVDLYFNSKINFDAAGTPHAVGSAGSLLHLGDPFNLVERLGGPPGGSGHGTPCSGGGSGGSVASLGSGSGCSSSIASSSGSTAARRCCAHVRPRCADAAQAPLLRRRCLPKGARASAAATATAQLDARLR